MASLELAERARSIALKVLRPGGHFVCKIFESGEATRLRKDLQGEFGQVRLHKPKASRAESFEIFLVAMKRKG
jgi:23S rRNA U2552 (ribose-2'-O)-methylase RlmE/FtsJ